jgi:hypothetical protein
MTDRRRTALVALAALGVGASRCALRARVPDDYDAIGFVRALGDYDLGALQPHFPGYPVYVALGRLAHIFFPSALDSAEAVSALAAAVTVLGLWRIGDGLGGVYAAMLAVGLYAGAAMPWMLGGSALSDGTASAFAVLGFALLGAPAWPLLAGLAIAFMLGVRASYWPIAVSWLWIAWRRRDRARSLSGASIGLLAWLLPFVGVVGPRPLLTLGRTHLIGHFTIWGGSVMTRPSLGHRAFAFARDLAYDGIAPNMVCLAFVAAAAVACVRRPTIAWQRVLVIVAPYAVWVFLAQNVVEQPRHLLPLVIAALVGLALIGARRPTLGAASSLAVALAGAPLGFAHARILPAAAQAAAHVARAYPARDVAIFGGRSIRFFDQLPIIRRERTWAAEVLVDLERVDVLPKHVLLTSEVLGEPTHAAHLTEGPTFCRDPRLDRQQPCLTLREYHLPGVIP